MVESYRDLIAWQKAMQLVAEVYRATLKLPDSERFGLVSQLRRAAVSVPSSLAEGHSRGSTKEFVRYIGIAMGSLAEIETQLLICLKLDLLAEAAVDHILGSCDERNRILRGLSESLTSKVEEEIRSSLAPRPSPL
jgi:four helix bundle protein